MTARWSRSSSSGGALGLYTIRAESAGALDKALRRLGIACCQGRVRLFRIDEVDELVVARGDAGTVCVSPHAGPEVARRVEEWLSAAGLVRDGGAVDPLGESEIEARALATLSRSMSPRAVDLLLAQHDCWSSEERSLDDAPDARDAGLRRLIEPPMVVAAGRPNAGKSTLLNALAGRSLAVVTDVAGTTLDHVGALIELDGLVVRWVDTAGIGPGEADGPVGSSLQAIAQARAIELARSADLAIEVIDASLGPAARLLGDVAHLTLASKIDRVDVRPAWPDLFCSALDESSVHRLAVELRRRLVSDAWLESDRPWRFW